MLASSSMRLKQQRRPRRSAAWSAKLTMIATFLLIVATLALLFD
jgi:hypothetical protein